MQCTVFNYRHCRTIAGQVAEDDLVPGIAANDVNNSSHRDVGNYPYLAKKIFTEG
jgi:hypothetical protein